mmetsp:Transcript_17558/g.37597  ORF Transcript_17558/g.37597 Transcript_17558/m.37597 type:complete len:159 (+) Transcript_17558:560-1036(+)
MGVPLTMTAQNMRAGLQMNTPCKTIQATRIPLTPSLDFLSPPWLEEEPPEPLAPEAGGGGDSAAGAFRLAKAKACCPQGPAARAATAEPQGCRTRARSRAKPARRKAWLATEAESMAEGRSDDDDDDEVEEEEEKWVELAAAAEAAAAAAGGEEDEED